MTRRLFLFAGYSSNGKTDDALTAYVRELARLGDVVVVMDNDGDISRLRPYAVYAAAGRHGEYDFGSYKRAWEYAAPADGYDFVYLVNDSVYLTGRIPIDEMESSGADATGMVWRAHKTRGHIQSWFIGMKPVVFKSKWFDEFMRGVKKQQSKGETTRLYEHGFTKGLDRHGLTHWCAYTVHGRDIYNKIRYMFDRGFPFVKKLSFTRHSGALGRQLLYVLRRCDPALRDAIMASADTRYLTNNPIRILWRNITYAWGKLWRKR